MQQNERKYFLIENKNYRTLNVLSLGREACAPLHSFGYAYTNFYLIHYVMRGCGTFVKNGKSHKVCAGQMFIIKPDNTYTYTADEKDPWEYMWFSFKGDIAAMFEALPDVMPVESTVITQMLRAEEYETMKMEYVTGKLYEFVAEIFEEKSARKDYVKIVEDFIKANYMRKIYVKDIAKMLNLNNKYLSRVFKAGKGVSLQEYIIAYKMQKAQALLFKGLSVAEAARLVGYDDMFAFSKMFKRYTGEAPSQIYTKKVTE